jgi:HSP20 family protein
MRPNPFDDLEEFFERMEEQFESGVGFRRNSVPVDVRDSEGEYVVVADLPGYTVENIELVFTDGRLHITGERDEETTTEDDRYLRQERREESVSRTVRLPEPILQDEIMASFDNGVLSVTLPKQLDGEEGKEIEIE